MVKKPKTTVIPVKDPQTDGASMSIITHYDDHLDAKFNGGIHRTPRGPRFRKYDDYARIHYLRNIGAETIPALALAEMNLRIRKMVGLVLGSSIKEFTDPPDDLIELNSHRDLDILILNPYSVNHPEPSEWGVDWWVRPEVQSPTNGRVSLWYDLELHPDVEINTKPLRSAPPFALDIDKNEVHHTPLETKKAMRLVEQVRRKVQPILIRPGLYLPDSVTVDKIRRHCNRQMKQKRKKALTQLMKLSIKVRRLELGSEKGPILFKIRTKSELDVLVNKFSKISDQLIRICKEARIPIPNGADKNWLGLKERLLKLNNPCLHVAMKLCDSLSRDIGDAIQSAVKEKNFNYLSLKGVQQKPILPVIPHQLLNFKPLK